MTHKKIVCFFGVILMLMGVFTLPTMASSYPAVTITQGDWVLSYSSYPSVSEFTRLTFDFTCNGVAYTSMVFNPANSRLIYYQGSTATTVRNGQIWTDTKYQNITVTATATIGANSGNQSLMAMWLVSNLESPAPSGYITINLYMPVFTPNTDTVAGQGSVYNGFTVSYELAETITWNLEDDGANYVDLIITAEKITSPSGTQFTCNVYAEYSSHPNAETLDYTYTTRDTRKVLTGYTLRRGAVLAPFEYVDYGMDVSTMTNTEMCIMYFDFVQEYGKNSTYNLYIGRPDLVIDYQGNTTDLDKLIGDAMQNLHDSLGDGGVKSNAIVKNALTVIWTNPLAMLFVVPALAFVVVKAVSKNG